MSDHEDRDKEEKNKTSEESNEVLNVFPSPRLLHQLLPNPYLTTFLNF